MKKIFLIAFLAFSIPAKHAQSVDLNFGAIEFIVGGGNLNSTLAPSNGSLICNNTANYTCQSFGTPGNTTIIGTIGNVVNISCNRTAAISNGSTNFTIAASNIYMQGKGTVSCAGRNKTVQTHTISSNPANNIVYWGGTLQVRGVGNSNFAGVYSSSLAGGAPQTIRIIFL